MRFSNQNETISEILYNHRLTQRQVMTEQVMTKGSGLATGHDVMSVMTCTGHDKETMVEQTFVTEQRNAILCAYLARENDRKSTIGG